ncbi:hypothetical protein XaC1_271 [Xanthomonas phage XaC1]|nr:hypothetical protein XaC1_271 [Xanthomonas phage XaC1]
MEYVKYKAYLGVDTLFDVSDADELLNSMCILIDSVEKEHIESTFDIVAEYINHTPFYYAHVCIPKWSESLLFIKFPEYEWKIE